MELQVTSWTAESQVNAIDSHPVSAVSVQLHNLHYDDTDSSVFYNQWRVESRWTAWVRSPQRQNFGSRNAETRHWACLQATQPRLKGECREKTWDPRVLRWGPQRGWDSGLEFTKRRKTPKLQDIYVSIFIDQRWTFQTLLLKTCFNWDTFQAKPWQLCVKH